MGLFDLIVKTVTLPIDIAKDVVTLGGVLTDEDKSFTEKKLDEIGEELSQ